VVRLEVVRLEVVRFEVVRLEVVRLEVVRLKVPLSVPDSSEKKICKASGKSHEGV